MRPPIAVSKKHVVYSEILAVTSAMRKNSRWASATQTISYSRDLALATSLGLRRTGSSGSISGNVRPDVELMAGFLDLKRQVRVIPDIDQMPLTTLFAPFLAMIRSTLSTGPITSVALTSLYSFFIAGFVTVNSLNLNVALAQLSNTVSNCKFEASDASGDEVVLYKIMAVIKECICSDVGRYLGDIEVCEMLETVLTTCCQMRLSETLRRNAENIMQAIVRQVFLRLSSLDPVVEEDKLVKAEAEQQDHGIKVNMQTIVEGTQSGHEEAKGVEPQPEAADSAAISNEPSMVTAEASDILHEPSSAPIEIQQERAEYGLPSILELLRVLINILDPNDRFHTDSTRLTALGVLNAAFEVSGPTIGKYPSLASLLLDHGCKYLFQLARSENPSVLYLSLRVIATMFESMQGHLRLQRELFFAFVIDKLSPTVVPKAQLLAAQQRLSNAPSRTSTPVLGGRGGITPPVEDAIEKEIVGPSRPAVMPARGETRELLLETLNQIARHPSFMVDLYMNYDCDVNSEDLFEKLVDFLTRGVYPVQAEGRHIQHQSSQLLCLDLLMEFIEHMGSRVSNENEQWPEDYPSPESLLSSKSTKRLILTGASRFNTKPKVGLSFLEENGLIHTGGSDGMSRSKSIAKFLKNCAWLDKRLLGDYISRPDNTDILREFVGLFDFKDKPVSDALRELLESFRLPGESQQISRITEEFAKHYVAYKPSDIKTEDAAYVLAYSVIMLNTDLHNPQNRRRMAVEDYQRNLRGVNDGSDFPTETLNFIYESIRKNEIVMPEEHTGRLGFEYAWKELLIRSRASGPYMSCNTAEFDRTMFKSTWKSVISAIAFAFTNFDDDYTIQRAIGCFRQCAILAGHFQLPEVFDYIVISLSHATGLLSDTLITSVPNYPVVDVDGEDVTVSALSVKFGTNFKGQLAAVVLFTIANGNGNAVKDGWTQIFELYQTLFLNSLLPTSMLRMEEFLGGSATIPLFSVQPTARPQGRSEGGLLSTLSSYLMTPYSSSSEPVIPDATDADIENTLCTIDCIAACRIDELYAQIPQLSGEALVAAVRALEALAYERTIARLKETEDSLYDEKSGPRMLPYDPASVYLLETLVSIVSKVPQCLDDTWPIVYEHLSSLLKSASHFSVLLIERVVMCLLRLCLHITDKPSLRDQLYLSLDLLAGLPREVINAVAEQIIDGLVRIVRDHRKIIQSSTEWNLIFALMRHTIGSPRAARQAFELLLSLCSSGPGQCLNSDNFVGIVNVLDDFGAVANDETNSRNRRSRRSQTIPESSDQAIARGRQAIDVLYDLKNHLPNFVQTAPISEVQAWKQYCLPLFMALSHQSANANRDIRHTALIDLQRLLLGPHATVEEDYHVQIDLVFNRLIFPLIDELLKPQVFQRDPQGMPETRLRASALLCKTFMHLQIRDNRKQDDIRVLWIQILDLLDRLMHIDKRDQLYEAIPESLKNVVLVMHATGILVPPGGADERTVQQRALWEATHDRIERFLPGFLEEVVPRPAVPAKPHVVPHLATHTSPVPASEVPPPVGPPPPPEEHVQTVVA